VVGRVFWAEPVARALERAAGDGVDTALLGLERRGLVLVRPTSTIAGQVEYAFKHALVRDVAYAALPRARRARAHATHAEWIETLAAGRRDEFAELIAHHYALAASGEDADLAWADQPDLREQIRSKAFDSLIAAGTAVRKRYALDKAVALHQQALDLATSDPERARAYTALADDHVAAFRGDEALEASREALAILRLDPSAAEARARVCATMAGMASERAGSFRVQPSGAEMDELIAEGLEATSDSETRGWLLASRGYAGVFRGSVERHDPVPLEERIAAAEEATRVGRELGNAELETFGGHALTELFLTAGRFADAVESSRAQLGLLDRVESRGERAHILFETGVTVTDLVGEYEEGLALAERSRQLARSLSAHELMHATFLILNSLFHLGRWSEMPEVLEEHLAALPGEADVACFAVQGGPLIGALALAHMGETARSSELAATLPPATGSMARRYEGLRARARIALGDVESGRALAEKVFETVVNWRAVEAALGVIEALVAEEEWGALAEFVPRAREIAVASGELGLACDRAEGLVEASRGNREGAVAKLTAALEGFERLKDRFEVARTREALAGVVEDAAERVRLLEQARDGYEELSAKPHMDRVSAAIAPEP
jgi:tetratricopeptide (TPR) repeat protein